MSALNLSKTTSQKTPPKIVPGPESKHVDSYNGGTIHLSVNPDLHKLLKNLYPTQGKIASHIRTLINLDIHRVADYEGPLIQKQKKSIKIPLPATIFNALPRRANQALCLNANDYVRTLLYSNLIMSGEMEFTLEGDLRVD
jgi:hypothetical protein